MITEKIITPKLLYNDPVPGEKLINPDTNSKKEHKKNVLKKSL
jgi:hypothetical protein